MSRKYDTELALTPFELRMISASPAILAALIKCHEAAADKTEYIPVRAQHMSRIKELLPLYEKALTETSSQ